MGYEDPHNIPKSNEVGISSRSPQVITAQLQICCSFFTKKGHSHSGIFQVFDDLTKSC